MINLWKLITIRPVHNIGSGVNEPSFRNKTFGVIVFHLQNLCIYPINIVFKFHCVNAKGRLFWLLVEGGPFVVFEGGMRVFEGGLK